MSSAPPIVGTRKYCKNCRTERVELIDKNGITDSGFNTWKWAQICEHCKRNDSLEYLPIRLGENLLETVNEALSESRPNISVSGKVALLVRDAGENIISKYQFLTVEETDEL